jgi:hypothetical protein
MFRRACVLFSAVLRQCCHRYLRRRRVDSLDCAALQAARAVALPSESLETETPTLVCARCRACIAAPADIMTEAYTQGRGTLWYPHELDLLDVDDVPTYGGAKDPTGASHYVATWTAALHFIATWQAALVCRGG